MPIKLCRVDAARVTVTFLASCISLWGAHGRIWWFLLGIAVFPACSSLMHWCCGQQAERCCTRRCGAKGCLEVMSQGYFGQHFLGLVHHWWWDLVPYETAGDEVGVCALGRVCESVPCGPLSAGPALLQQEGDPTEVSRSPLTRPWLNDMVRPALKVSEHRVKNIAVTWHQTSAPQKLTPPAPARLNRF